MGLIDSKKAIKALTHWETEATDEEIIYTINNLPTVEAIPKAEYEARLKADLEAILKDLQLEIEETEIDNNVPFGFEPVSKTSAFYEGVSASSKVIQQRINALKGE